MMRTLLSIALTTTALLSSAACTPADDTPDAQDRFASVLPTARVMVELPANRRAIGETAEMFSWTQNATNDVNGIIGSVLETLDTLTDFEPTFNTTDNEYVWGPFDDGSLDATETALYVRHDVEADTYGWAIIERFKGDDLALDEGWELIVVGEGTPGVTDGTGSGGFIVDFDRMRTFDSSSTTTGTFASTYDLTETTATASAIFSGLGDDGESSDGVYEYGLDEMGGFLELGLTIDVADGEDDEVLLLRSRWDETGAGRGDAITFGGDLGLVVVAGTQCWDDNALSVFEETNWTGVDGDESACVFDTAEYPADAPTPE